MFGPVSSRRLGFSLGISPIPHKTCNYSCVYCQLGRTDRMPEQRASYCDPEEIVAEVREALRTGDGKVDFITFAGEGEPTLSSDLGTIIRRIKAFSDVPVAVITNGSLLGREDVRQDLAEADLVMPSLDAGDPDTFASVNRPRGTIRFEDMVDGLVAFREAFTGDLWLEVMLVAGVNDDDRSLRAIRAWVDRIRPDRVFVNAPVRPPAESDVRPPDSDRLQHARELLGETPVDAVPASRPNGALRIESPDALSDIIRNHPMSLSSVLEIVPKDWVDALLEAGRIRSVMRLDQAFLVPGDGNYERDQPVNHS